MLKRNTLQILKFTIPKRSKLNLVVSMIFGYMDANTAPCPGIFLADQVRMVKSFTCVVDFSPRRYEWSAATMISLFMTDGLYGDAMVDGDVTVVEHKSTSVFI